jgi:hypothetical protein
MSSQQRANEARAKIAAYRADLARHIQDETMEQVDGVVRVHSPLRQGATSEARAYAFAFGLVRDLGPSEASRIADLVVKHVQTISREAW